MVPARVNQVLEPLDELEDLAAIDRPAAIMVPFGLKEIENLLPGMVIDGVEAVVPIAISNRSRSVFCADVCQMSEPERGQRAGQESALAFGIWLARKIGHVYQLAKCLVEGCLDLSDMQVAHCVISISKCRAGPLGRMSDATTTTFSRGDGRTRPGLGQVSHRLRWTVGHRVAPNHSPGLGRDPPAWCTFGAAAPPRFPSLPKTLMILQWS